MTRLRLACCIVLVTTMTGCHQPEDYFVGPSQADEVLRLTGAPGPIVERPLPVDDPKVRQPDITRARATLGWEATVPLEQGLRRTIEYFRGIEPRLSAGSA